MLTPYDRTIDLRVERDLQGAEGRLAVRLGDDVGRRRSTAIYPNPQNVFTLINIRGGVTPANTALLEASAEERSRTRRSRPRSSSSTAQEQGINILLNLLFVLLGFSAS